MSKAYVLDANALLDFVEAGPGFRKVRDLLDAAFEEKKAVLISVLNWAEVFYLLWQRRGEDTARRVIAGLARLPLHFVPVDLQQAVHAGEIKARHKIPYVDCIAAALAIERQAVLVTSDRDFEKLGHRIQVLWIARR